MIKIILTNLLFFISVIATYPQSYKLSGRFNNLSGQGMAIDGDYAYILNNTGYCRVYNLLDSVCVAGFFLESSHSSNHANCASLKKVADGSGAKTLIYISECAKPYKCYVEQLSADKSNSRLVQTIIPLSNSAPKMIHDWIVDGEYLYGITSVPKQNDTLSLRTIIIYKYRLPLLSDSIVFLTDDKILDKFNVSFPNILQGGVIREHLLYLPVGLHESSTKSRLDKDRALIVIDLYKHAIVKTIDLNEITLYEPEDVDFYKDELYLFCGQKGGLYRIPY